MNYGVYFLLYYLLQHEKDIMQKVSVSHIVHNKSTSINALELAESMRAESMRPWNCDLFSIVFNIKFSFQIISKVKIFHHC